MEHPLDSDVEDVDPASPETDTCPEPSVGKVAVLDVAAAVTKPELGVVLLGSSSSAVVEVAGGALPSEQEHDRLIIISHEQFGILAFCVVLNVMQFRHDLTEAYGPPRC